VSLFCTLAVVAILVLLIRRNPSVAGGELGGPRRVKTVTSAIFGGLWLTYVTVSTLQAYGYFD